MLKRWSAVLVFLVHTHACLAYGQNNTLPDALSQFEGPVYIAGDSGFNPTDSLANSLRRGPSPYFEPSAPSFYITPASEQEVVEAVRFAIDSDHKLSMRGGGACKSSCCSEEAHSIALWVA